MRSFKRAIFCVIVAFACVWGNDDRDRDGKAPIANLPNNRKKALLSWAKSLTDQDHNSTHWSVTMRKQPQNFFYEYAKRLTQIFKESNAIVNFVLVGACDGTNDNTISEHYFPNSNWHGLFVEPVSYNYKDLQHYLGVNHASDRSHTINAAVTDVCETQNVSFKVSITEETNPEAAHWLRRQIGSIVKENEKLNPKQWRTETVPCLTPVQIMADWTLHTSKAKITDKEMKRKRQRVHVLKVDAEGHDYKVLNGFMGDEFAAHELPLIISYEAKSMGDNLEVIRERLEQRGYVNSFGTTNDGFSLLRADFILQTIGKKGDGPAGGNKQKKRPPKKESADGRRDDGPGMPADGVELKTPGKGRGKRKGKGGGGGGGRGNKGQGRGSRQVEVEEEN